MSSQDLRDMLARTLGSEYTFERELGRGGMSRTYVAEERAFGRRVVVKVLPPEVTERVSLERFRREILFVAKLQHPNIVPVLEAGEAEGVLYYTMPFVAGRSLRERLSEQQALPIAETVGILADVASALACAHAHRIVHRDIKPENILLTGDRALVADFGIAKAVAEVPEDELEPRTTITESGKSLGTPAYMSPEQVAGDRRIDHRSDLYSLGIVAYELLAGHSPFTGRSVRAIMAAHITEAAVPVSVLRPSTPPALAVLVMRMLEKHPGDRPQSADEIVHELDAIRHGGTGQGPPAASMPAIRFRMPGALPWALSALLGVATIILAILLVRGAPTQSTEAEVRRWNIVLPDSAPLTFVGSAALAIARPALAISRDGQTLVYVARSDSTTVLMRRRLDESTVTILPGTSGAFQPFFSPDGRWVGFFVAGELRRVSADGGRPQTIAQVNEPVGGMWLDEERILIAEQQGRRLSEVSAAGGVPRVVRDLSGRGTSLPQLIAGEWVLGARAREITLISLTTGEQRVLTRFGFAALDSVDAADVVLGSMPRYVPSGHILYLSSGQDGVLMALPFDVQEQRVLGAPVPVLSGVRQEAEVGAGQFAVADDGTLVFAPGGSSSQSRLAWMHRSGRLEYLPFPRADHGEFRLSPDGKRILARVWPPAGRAEIWLYDLERNTHRKIEFARSVTIAGGGWWPDNRSIVVSLGRQDGRPDVTVRRTVDGTMTEDTIWRNGTVWAISPDTRRLVVSDHALTASSFLLVSRDSGSFPPIPLGHAPFPAFSPNGEWLAFTSNRSGQSEVYVARVNDPREVHKISVGGGEEGIWTSDGREIVYRNGPRWFTVRVSTGQRLSYSAPHPLFHGPFINVPGLSHDIGPDGAHLVLVGSVTESTTRLDVITGWFAELQRLAPANKR